VGRQIPACGWPVSGWWTRVWVYFWPETWRTMGGGVWAVVGVAEGTGRPFLSPVIGAGVRWTLDGTGGPERGRAASEV